MTQETCRNSFLRHDQQLSSTMSEHRSNSTNASALTVNPTHVHPPVESDAHETKLPSRLANNKPPSAPPHELPRPDAASAGPCRSLGAVAQPSNAPGQPSIQGPPQISEGGSRGSSQINMIG